MRYDSDMSRFDLAAPLGPENTPAPAARRSARAKPAASSMPQNQAVERIFPRWARKPADARELAFFAGAGLALLDASLRENPPFAGAVRQRLALRAATACATPNIWLRAARRHRPAPPGAFIAYGASSRPAHSGSTPRPCESRLILLD